MWVKEIERLSEPITLIRSSEHLEFLMPTDCFESFPSLTIRYVSIGQSSTSHCDLFLFIKFSNKKKTENKNK